MTLYYRCLNLLDYIRYNIPRGIRNLIRWFPVIWRDFDWDWSPLARMMEKKLRYMAACQDGYVGAERERLRMLVCANILRKLQEEHYTDNCQTREEYLRAANRARADQLLLGTLLGKHLRKWWS